MKRCLVIILLTVCTSAAIAQTRIPPLDQSIMDMSYYPATYPILKIQDKVTEPLVARVIYSRPLKSGRGVFGELVEYEKVWRLGANEATEIEFFQNVVFGGKPVAKGRYTLYAIPALSKWTVIVNKEVDTWGSFIYDSKKDLIRVDVPVQKLAEPVEPFTLFFEKTTTGFDLVAAWENVEVNIPIMLSKSTVKSAAKSTKK